MTPHDHTTLVPGCYRCELGRDEALDALGDTLRPIIERTYGKSPMAQALADHLAVKIMDYDGDDRQRMILMTCWDWFSGGSTAEFVAERIEAELDGTTDQEGGAS